ncbi:MAG: hypothetical protein HYY24_11800 [Verrucomicrobia bacterium]|nr:hypothetical protein [Verrucomicrobiota bacterium]
MAPLALMLPLSPWGGGLPEPDLVLYGTIRDVSGGLNTRLTAGALNWTFQPAGAGKPFTVTATLTNINDQFSYVVRIPCETLIAGFAASDATLALGKVYDRALVSVDNQPATFVEASQQTLTLALTDRGRIERVDLQVPIGGSRLLPENWQLQYFGRTGVDPLADPDGDGMDNLGEFRVGTNPVDPSSVFEIEIAADAAGGPRLTWFSAAGVVYTLRRSQALLTGFEDLAVNIAATPPLNSYQDGTAVGQGPYFYRVLAKPAGQ